MQESKMRGIIKIIIQAIVIVAATAVIAAGTNLIRSDGIPLVTDIPYDIFAPCADSDVVSKNVTVGELAKRQTDILYVDARPKEMFEAEHVEGAINAPYSVLDGTTKEDIERVAKESVKRGASSVVVYGVYEGVDLGKSLAEQLIEANVKGVRHVEGGLEVLNKTGIKTVKKSGDSK